MRAETYEEAGYWEARADYLEHELKRALARIDALESTVEDLNQGARAALRGGGGGDSSTEAGMLRVWLGLLEDVPTLLQAVNLESAERAVAGMATEAARMADAAVLRPESGIRALAMTAAYASRFLPKDADPLALALAEYRRAAEKHPGMTLECDGHTDASRLFALMEEVGEVAACLTYDNTDSTGHNSDLADEAVQVIGLALAWATRYLES
jgi:hypothetical protein|nr:MAG TPA: hypothetical protein [Caudoviricetes sp.]